MIRFGFVSGSIPKTKKYIYFKVRILCYLLVVVVLANVLSCTTANQNQAVTTTRPAAWAIPVKKKGVPNLHKISNTLYRSAQPNKDGMKELEAMGIKTVINLREFGSDKDYLENTKLISKPIPMRTWKPSEYEVIEFLKLATNPQYAPVLVHCKHGADRTGMMCAVYRIVVQDWSKQEAIEEMTYGGYGFNSVWNKLITWIKELDVEKIKANVGKKQTSL